MATRSNEPKTNCFLCRIAPFLVILGLIASSSAQEKAGHDSGLKLIFSTTKQAYQFLEPIGFDFVLSNASDKPITSRTVLTFKCCLRMEVIRNGKMVDAGQLSAIQAPSIGQPQIIPANSKLPPQTAILQFRLSEIFPEPGTYEVRFIQDGLSGEKLVSEFAEVTILEPDLADKRALKYLRKKADGNRNIPLDEPIGWQNDDLQKVLEEFLILYESSSYADLARFRLGELYFAIKEFEKAEQLFRKVDESKEFALSKSVEFYLSQLVKKNSGPNR